MVQCEGFVSNGTSNGILNKDVHSHGDDQGNFGDYGQLFFVTSYNSFDKLAHGPRGTEATYPISLYRFHPHNGSLVLQNILQKTAKVNQGLVNPAFSRYHPRLNVVYTCTEDIDQNGLVFAFKIGCNGDLTQLGQPVDAGGTSTCYLTIDKSQTHLIVTNYWDSTLSTIQLDFGTGELKGPTMHTYDPRQGRKVKSTGRMLGGVNHSDNDECTILMRQKDPHSHSLVFDPIVGIVAYVPDLGKDLIRELFYKDGRIVLELNVIPSGLYSSMPDGPRYFEFHPKYNTAYVVNELSSTIGVFEVDRTLLLALKNTNDPSLYKGRSTLRFVQSIKTIPSAFPTTFNTCGRICVHKSGLFVVVSNRGHQSIACFRVITYGCNRGQLVLVDHFHTRGETPRHFQFDDSGQFLLVANQDTDALTVFKFNLSSGQITFTGNDYRVRSPNFVCCCPTHQEYEDSHDQILDFCSPKLSGVEVGGERNGDAVSTCSNTSITSTIEVNQMQNNKDRDLVEELNRALFEISELKLLLQASAVSESRGPLE